MKVPVHILTLITLLAIALLFPISTKACTCPEWFTPPCAAYGRADAVLIGTLLKIGEASDVGHETPFYFQVEKSFKGIADKQIETYVRLGSCYDGVSWKIGEKYLVYAYKVGSRLELRPCDRTRLLADADADLSYLNNLKDATQSISGMIEGLTDEELKAMEVVYLGDQLNIQPSLNETRGVLLIKRDSFGRYSADLPQAGTYRVRFTFPFEVKLYAHNVMTETKPSQTTLEYTVTLAERQCHYREIYLVRVN